MGSEVITLLLPGTFQCNIRLARDGEKLLQSNPYPTAGILRNLFEAA